jgi:DNA-binding transcriptional LysR family regulator
MELRHLRYFVGVAESLHFGEAASRLGISQPSLSQQIRQLEQELQTSLLRRTKRRVELTEAGHLFLNEAREILARADRAAVIAHRIGRQGGPKLRVGIGYCMDQLALAKAVSTFSVSNPQVRVELQTMAVTRQLAELRDGRLDVALVRYAPTEGILESEPLHTEELIVAVPPQHRLAGKKTVSLASLAHEGFVLTSREHVPVYHDIVLKTCRQGGFVPNALHEVDHLYMLIGFIGAGCGVGLVPAFLERTRPRRVAFASLRPGSHPLQTVAVWRRDHGSNEIKDFVAVMRQALLPAGQRTAMRRAKKPLLSALVKQADGSERIRTLPKQKRQL